MFKKNKDSTEKQAIITKLTPEQEAAMPGYVNKWISIGIDTKRIDETKLRGLVDAVYAAPGVALNPPEEIIVLDSPLQGAICAYLANNGKDYKTFAETKQFDKAGLKADKKKFQDVLYLALYGQHDASWLAFFDFFGTECGLEKQIAPCGPYMELAKEVGWCWFFDKLAIVTQKPLYIHRKGRVLHCDTGPAIEYADGFRQFSLNGIPVPENKEHFVLNPASEISVQDVMKEENVDLRRELLRKIGLDRFITDTNAKTIDELTIIIPKINGKNRTCVYKLLEINLGVNEAGESITARVLKMDNPSIDAMHVEGVEDSCNTVEEALAWRNGMDRYYPPVQLS